MSEKIELSLFSLISVDVLKAEIFSNLSNYDILNLSEVSKELRNLAKTIFPRLFKIRREINLSRNCNQCGKSILRGNNIIYFGLLPSVIFCSESCKILFNHIISKKSKESAWIDISHHNFQTYNHNHSKKDRLDPLRATPRINVHQNSHSKKANLEPIVLGDDPISSSLFKNW